MGWTIPADAHEPPGLPGLRRGKALHGPALAGVVRKTPLHGLSGSGMG